jgi:hypothetical protein
MNRKKVTIMAVVILTALFLQPMGQSQAANSPHLVLSKFKSYYPVKGANPSMASSVAGGLGAVTYQPGGTIISEPNIYVIWYGNWDAKSCSDENGASSSTPAIVQDFLGALGESAWNKINTTYFQIAHDKKTFVQLTGDVKGCVVDQNSQGLSLDAQTGPQIADVVDNALSTRTLKTDPNGVYLVLTASNVQVADFMTAYCAYHGAYDNGQATIKYAFIGDASSNLKQCAPQVNTSPNGNPAADAMVSAIAHEFVEAVSDPEGLSWYDQAGFENADKCAWSYGTATKTANGSFSNMTLGDRQYLVQQNVAANTNICRLSLGDSENQSKQAHQVDSSPNSTQSDGSHPSHASTNR